MTIDPADRRVPLLELLLRYRSEDAADQAQCERIKSFVEMTAECFNRTYLAGHITGSAWVVDKTGTRVLLTHHKKLNKWLQLGGHADGNPDVLAVALREAKEESGLKDIRALSKEIFDLDVHPIPERPDEPAHFHYDVRFAFQTDGSEKFTANHESQELQWVDIAIISSHTNEGSLLRMARKYKKLLSKQKFLS